MLYVPVTLMVSLVYTIIMINLRDPTNVEKQRSLDAISDFIIYSIFMLISLTSIIYSYQLLLRPGINRSMRVQFFKHQLSYSLIAIVNFGAYLMFDLYNLFKFGSLNDGINSVIRDFVIEAVMPLLNFIFFVRSNREMIFGKESSEDKTLDTFLSSSLNVELVYVILTSIVEFVKDR